MLSKTPSGETELLPLTRGVCHIKHVPISPIVRRVEAGEQEDDGTTSAIQGLQRGIAIGLGAVDTIRAARQGGEDEKSMTHAHDSVRDVLKVERNVLVAIIMSAVMDRALGQRSDHPPYGIFEMKKENRDDHAPKKRFKETVGKFERTGLGVPPEGIGQIRKNQFRFLRKAMYATLSKYTQEFLESPSATEKCSEEIMCQVIRRFERNVVIPVRGREVTTDPLKFIARGIGTATRFMTGVLNLIPELMLREKVQGNPIDIAEKSFPIIMEAAMLHLEIFTKIRGINETTMPFEEEKWDPRFFKFIWDGEIGVGIPQVAFQNGIVDEAKRNTEGIMEATETGCPVRMHGGIKKLWKWFLEIAPDIYEAYPVWSKTAP